MTTTVDADLSPPPFCDLAWGRAGGGRFIATKTPLYEAVVACAGHNMEASGFDLRSPLVELDLTGCRDLPALAKRLAIWTSAAGKRLAFEQARDAALKPPAADAVASLQAGLVEMMSTAAWALGGRIDLANRFAHAGSLTRKQYEWAQDILNGARSAVASADARLATAAGAEALERAYDPDVREDLLAACRELSALDGDRCREANGQGWSAVSSGPGHRLAGMTALTPLQAAHAIALVFPHRRQLSEDLRERLFRTAPTPGSRHG